MKKKIKKDIVSIDYNSTHNFFSKRAKKYDKDIPYVSTMYQDNNPELTILRDESEKNLIEPQLLLNKSCSVLDIGCGVGRWAELLKNKVCRYLGIDFNEELIKLAKQRVGIEQRKVMFQKIGAQDISESEKLLITPPFNRFIISGVLIYLNDEDIKKCFNSISSLSSENAIVYIREPIAIESRLTLNKYYSDELCTEYSAIYRTIEEYHQIFKQTLFKHGFEIKKQEWLFSNQFNNRKETSQYYFIIERKKENG